MGDIPGFQGVFYCAGREKDDFSVSGSGALPCGKCLCAAGQEWDAIESVVLW